MCTLSDDDSEVEIALDDEVSQTCFIGMSDSEESQTEVPKFSFNHYDVQIDYLITKILLSDFVSSKEFKRLQYVVEELTHSNVALNNKVRDVMIENELLEYAHIFEMDYAYKKIHSVEKAFWKIRINLFQTLKLCYKKN